MEVSTEESKNLTNSTNNTSADISMNGWKLEEVNSFKYLGATLCKDGTRSTEIRIRIASEMAAMVRFNRIWQSNIISFESKSKLYKSLVISVLLYGFEIWTPLADSAERIRAFHTKCLRRFLRISKLEHKTKQLGAEQDQLFYGFT